VVKTIEMGLYSADFIACHRELPLPCHLEHISYHVQCSSSSSPSLPSSHTSTAYTLPCSSGSHQVNRSDHPSTHSVNALNEERSSFSVSGSRFSSYISLMSSRLDRVSPHPGHPGRPHRPTPAVQGSHKSHPETGSFRCGDISWSTSSRRCRV